MVSDSLLSITIIIILMLTSVQNMTGPECERCTSPCMIELATCTGLSGMNSTDDDDMSSGAGVPNEAVVAIEYCSEFDL